jgi:hypothetical protein
MVRSTSADSRKNGARSSRPVLILFYNPSWMAVPDEGPICDGRGELTFDRSRIGEADAVVFHIPSIPPSVRLRKRRGQRWVALSMESDVNYPQLRNRKFMAQFDYFMTYRLDSDFPTLYAGAGMPADLATPVKPKTAEALAVYMASNRSDRSGRTEYVREMMRHMLIDSYGRCLQNRTLPDDRGRQTKLDTIARYKFTLAFENSITRDYVTEKFFDPLIAGSVPVYLGAPNVGDFAPGNRCYIDVSDFGGPRDLVDYLVHLANDDEDYLRYLAWKDEPFREEFLRQIELSSVSPFERLCLAMMKRG